MGTMGREENSTTQGEKHHRHLVRAQRDTLEYLSRRGEMTQVQMAAVIGTSPSTVTRELRRGRVVNVDSQLKKRFVYSAEKAQQEATLAASAKGPRMKLTNSMRAMLDPLLAEGKLSPKDALATLRDRGVKGLPSYKTLYNAIHAGHMGVVTMELPYRTCKRPKGKRLKRKAFTGRGNRSIEERPAHVEERKEFGHWEIDLVVGRMGTRPSLLTITERSTRIIIIVRLRHRSQKAVVAALRKLMRDGAMGLVLSLTCDNGAEFLDQKALERALCGAMVYYAHPYSAYERGSNENANRIVRRFYPKGTHFGDLSGADVRWLQMRINAIHRDVLGGITAQQAVDRAMKTAA